MGAIIVITIGTAAGTLLAIWLQHWVRQWLRRRVQAWRKQQ